MAVISRYFTEFGSFGASYVKVVEVTLLDPRLRQKCRTKNPSFPQ